MSAEKDIPFQLPVEYSIALEVARCNKGMILPNAPGKDSAKDFVIFVPVKYEVKCDFESKATRNAFLEVHNCRLNKPSGLTATKADWWLHYTPGDARVYRFKPKRMLAWLENESGIKLYTAGGDGNSNGYIVPLDTLIKLPFVTSFQLMA